MPFTKKPAHIACDEETATALRRLRADVKRLVRRVRGRPAEPPPATR